MNRQWLMRGLMRGVALLTTASLGACANAPASSPRGMLKDLTDFALVYTDGGKAKPKPMTVAQTAEVLKDFDVIFMGEVHRHPANHIAQMALFRAIHERASNMSLSMEQFERDVQPAVDTFMAGKMGEEPFRKAARAWDNYPSSYRPLVEYAKEHGLPVIAAEAPTMVVRCVGEKGPDFLGTMKPEQRGWAAAQLNLFDGAYKDKFLGFTTSNAGHGEDGAKDKPKELSAAALRSFAAQVTRDDTMAESIYLHLQKNPGRKVVHLNGNFHSESFLGTAERLQLRDPKLKIAVVNPIQIRKSAGLDVSAENAKTGTFVLQILEAPKSYASDEEERVAITEQMKFRGANKCEL